MAVLAANRRCKISGLAFNRPSEAGLSLDASGGVSEVGGAAEFTRQAGAIRHSGSM